MSSILDVNGNINTDKLSKELRAALDADVKYKQTDNMKKRACRTAADYDQFKAMVECAHLKKLTRPEVESLSHVKKGWQKKVTKDNSSSAVLLSEELQKLEMINGANKIDHSVVANRKPKTPMEMDRDLRRIVNTEEKLR